MAKKTPSRKKAASKPKATKRTTSTTKKPSTKGRKSTPRNASSKAKNTKTTRKTKSRKAGDEEVTIDRRRNADRHTSDSSKNPAPIIERREKVQRRRQIDPTTCERDYSVQEVTFMKAMDKYKRKSGRGFPTCSEILEVVRSLGYVQLTPAELAAQPGSKGQDALADADRDLATNDNTNDHPEAVGAPEPGQF